LWFQTPVQGFARTVAAECVLVLNRMGNYTRNPPLIVIICVYFDRLLAITALLIDDKRASWVVKTTLELEQALDGQDLLQLGHCISVDGLSDAKSEELHCAATELIFRRATLRAVEVASVSEPRNLPLHQRCLGAVGDRLLVSECRLTARTPLWMQC